MLIRSRMNGKILGVIAAGVLGLGHVYATEFNLTFNGGGMSAHGQLDVVNGVATGGYLDVTSGAAAGDYTLDVFTSLPYEYDYNGTEIPFNVVEDANGDEPFGDLTVHPGSPDPFDYIGLDFSSLAHNGNGSPYEVVNLSLDPSNAAPGNTEFYGVGVDGYVNPAVDGVATVPDAASTLILLGGAVAGVLILHRRPLLA